MSKMTTPIMEEMIPGQKINNESNELEKEIQEKRIKVLSIEEMEKNWNTLDHDECCLYQVLTVDFIKRHEKDIRFDLLSVNANLTLDIIEAFKDKISWTSICLNNKKLTDSFIYNYREYLNWEMVMANQKLNLQLLVVLSELYRKKETAPSNRKSFWNAVSRYQKIVVDYATSYNRYLNFNLMSKNLDVDELTLDKYLFKFNTRVLLNTRTLPKWILLKHKDYFDTFMN